MVSFFEKPPQKKGAVICKKSQIDKFNELYGYFSTFGGNNVSAAVGIAVIDVIEKNVSKNFFCLVFVEDLQESHLALQRHGRCVQNWSFETQSEVAAV